jgi:Asp-tRNA(Asn)/Glu-tRNA(Gln) amidotransferase A subunit family amidase
MPFGYAAIPRIETYTSSDCVGRARSCATARGAPLHGVPYCLKDIVETAGIRTTGQSKLLAGHIPAEDAVVASKLRDAGGILLGKTATWEFAHGGPS